MHSFAESPLPIANANKLSTGNRNSPLETGILHWQQNILSNTFFKKGKFLTTLLEVKGRLGLQN